ncbi:hypothetical protein LAL4801_05849 [Roseibium aggregatum]|uniref:Uncharacterized protein n=1 Tax=Roseibium aggregatum TaxID=187304 RepID=A0A0M6YDR9_9HYPH|nr:hypothetical protein LAL4801_05849 [Roseibium aggregatum]
MEKFFAGLDVSKAETSYVFATKQACSCLRRRV